MAGRLSRQIQIIAHQRPLIIGDSGMMNFPNIFKKGYEIGILGYYVELEGDRKGRTQFEGLRRVHNIYKTQTLLNNVYLV